jgi:hypothetical protein
MSSGLPLASLLESARGFEIIGFLFWIWMIAECWKRERPSMQKWLWLLLVVCVPDIGSLIYFLLRVARVHK